MKSNGNSPPNETKREPPPAPRSAEDLAQLVDVTGQRSRKNRLLLGTGLVVLAVVGWLAAVGLVDIFLPLHVLFRVVAYGLLLAAVLFVAVFFFGLPLLRPPTRLRTSARIEGTVPGMHNRLVTVLDVLRRGTADTHAGMFESLVEQTCRRLGDFRVEHVADPRPARRALCAAGGLTLAAAILTGVLYNRLPIAYARILRPLAPIAPATWVRFRALPGNLDVLRGEPVTLRAVFRRGRAKQLFVCTRSEDEGWVTYPMEPDAEDGFRFDISRLDTSCEYYIKGARTWTPAYRLTALDRPAVSDLAAEVVLPEYMGLWEPRPVDRHATQISAPIGSAVRITAQVSGDPHQGFIQHFEAVTSERVGVHEEETVWFDDDIPSDATPNGPWHWTERRAAGGKRSHTFNWSHRPYGFSTRLNRLSVPPEGELVVYAWLDPRDPPTRVEITFTVDEKEARTVWTPVASSEAPPVPEGHTSGALPPPGDWGRLTTSLGALCASLGRPAPTSTVTVSAIQFGADKGRVWFDRVGWSRTQRETTTETELKPSYAVDMQFDEASGRWSGVTPVSTDTHVALRFVDGHGYRNATMQPIPVLATEDRPPALVVEKPGRDVTITRVEPVPVVVRAFDDYGVDAIGLAVGPAADQLGEPRWITEYDEARTTQVALTGVDPGTQELQPGQSLYYRFSARDRKGQTVVSKPFRVALAQPQDTAAAEKALPLPGLLEGVRKLVEFPERLTAPLAELLAHLPVTERPNIEYAGVLVLVDPEGRRMDRDEVRAFFEGFGADMTDEQKQQMEAINRMLAEQRALADELVTELQSAAQDADGSVMGLPYEDAVLSSMAERARMTADGLAPEDAGLAAFLEWQAAPRDDAMQLVPREQLGGIQNQLESLLAAHDLLGGEPEDAQVETATRMAALRADYALDDLETLQDVFETEAQELETMRTHLTELRRATSDAAPLQLAEIGAEQRELDAKALELLERVRGLVDERRDRGEEAPVLPQAPWAPPGAEDAQAPVEEDTPPEEGGGGPAQADPEKLALTVAELEALLETTPEWWDRPIRMRTPEGDAPVDERYADRERDVPAGGVSAGGSPEDILAEALTPRAMLAEHQDGLRRELTSSARALQQNLALTQQMAHEIRTMVDDLQVTDMPLSRSVRSQALEHTMAQLGSPEMTGLMNMAALARMRRMGVPLTAAPSSGGGNWGSGASLVVGVYAEAPDLAPGHRASLYRLPPDLREPLMQGLQERTPEGYRPLVDAYYRKLSEESE